MTRAVSPVLGVVLLAAVTVILAAVIGVATVSTAPPPEPATPFTLSASVDASTGRIVLMHRSPTALDVGEIEIRISVDGERLPHQPSVPFYSETGFGAFPTGPFNPSADPTWEPYEPASLTATGENADLIAEGTAVRVEMYRDRLRIAETETEVD